MAVLFILVSYLTLTRATLYLMESVILRKNILFPFETIL